MTTSSRPLVVGLGEILWDLLPEGRQLGGAPANFAYHAAALGTEGVVVSCVGQDELGREILARLDAMGLGHDHVVVDPRHATGTVSVELDAQGKADYVIHQPVAWDFLPESAALDALAARADAVCFGSLAQRSEVTRATIRRFLAATPPSCLRIFDINLRQDFYDRDTIARSLASANVLKLNDEELPVLAEMFALSGDETELLDELIARFSLRVVALTKGAQGSVLVADGRRSVLPGAEVAIVDTVGAGDAFTAALALGLLRQWDLDAIHRRAGQVAAFVCTQQGATPTLPNELTERA
ncbi:MAG: carbohydrate kinase [Pirellulales bacterium]|nr:carbohydrate kinase [Pirellulales bacterium]